MQLKKDVYVLYMYDFFEIYFIIIIFLNEVYKCVGKNMIVHTLYV
jgi:hypothetical protein